MVLRQSGYVFSLGYADTTCLSVGGYKRFSPGKYIEKVAKLNGAHFLCVYINQQRTKVDQTVDQKWPERQNPGQKKSENPSLLLLKGPLWSF